MAGNKKSREEDAETPKEIGVEEETDIEEGEIRNEVWEEPPWTEKEISPGLHIHIRPDIPRALSRPKARSINEDENSSSFRVFQVPRPSMGLPGKESVLDASRQKQSPKTKAPMQELIPESNKKGRGWTFAFEIKGLQRKVIKERTSEKPTEGLLQMGTLRTKESHTD